MRAFVTSGSLLVTTSAKRHACALRPHATSRGELKARGARAARGPKGGHLRTLMRPSGFAVR
jgi:hypothetical protein